MTTGKGLPPLIKEAIEAGVAPVTALRVMEDMTIPELADEADMNPIRLIEIEAGATPDLEELTALGDALDVGPDQLVE